MKFYWESNLYWELGDTLGYYIHRDLTDDLEYVSYDTTYVTGFLVWKFQPQMYHLLVTPMEKYPI